MLRTHPAQRLRVFVVWMPVLPTDFTAPNTSAMARIPDLRARQFWDPERLVAKAIAAAGPGQPRPECCEIYGVPWDVAAIYPPGVQWSGQLPPATFLNGPLLDIQEQIDAAMKAAAR